MGSPRSLESHESPRSNYWVASTAGFDTQMGEEASVYGDTIPCYQPLSHSYDRAPPSFIPVHLTTPRYIASSPLNLEIGLQERYSGLQPQRWHATYTSEFGRDNEAVSHLGESPPERLRQQPKHPQGPSHRPLWRCVWPGCEKVYTRRDTLARHHAKHKDGGHVCELCRHGGKFTVFKRKDHLNGHVRNCHKENTNNSGQLLGDATALSELGPQSFATQGNGNNPGQFAEVTSALSGLEPQNQIQHFGCDDWSIGDRIEDKDKKDSSHATGGCVEPHKQQQAMSDLIQILSRVLGDQWQEIMEMLEDRVTSLSGSSVQSLAECMANVALIKTELQSPDHSESTHRGIQELLS